MNTRDVVGHLVRDGFILVFNRNELDVVKTAQALREAGINNIEVTCRIARPLEKIARLRKELPDFVIGAASLVDYPGVLEVYNKSHKAEPLPRLSQAVEAGADFLVSAGNFRPESYEKFAGKAAMIPGCGSVTEILSQFSLGANFCKLFPARQLGGPGFIRAIDPAIHRTVSIIPTGGTNAENIAEYIDAGVLVVGGSFGVIEENKLQRIIQEQDYRLLAEQLRRIKQLIDVCRHNRWPEIAFAEASIEEIALITGRDFNLG